MLFTLQLILFSILSVTCFTIPGLLILNKCSIKLEHWEKSIISTALGFVLFTLVSYFLLVLNVSFIIIPLLLSINFFAIKTLYKLNFFSLNKLNFKKSFIPVFLVFFIGIVGQLAIIAPSGLYINNELIFWSSHGHDGPWHIALMEEIKKGAPLQNPTFAGEKLVNYHFFSDIAPAQFSKYFYLPNLDLYFRFFPLLYSLLLGGIVFIIGRKLGGNVLAGIWATIFTYFAGSFGYIVTLLREGKIGGESIFWATQIQSSIGNPPQIVSNIILLTFIFLFAIWIEKKSNWRLFIVCALLAGSLISFKVYAALVLFIGLGFVGLWELVKEKQAYILSLALISGILSLILYLPYSAGSTQFLIFQPWWFIRTMVVESSRLNLLDWELRRQTYIAEDNLKRVIQLEVNAFLIFFFGNLGMRFLGLSEFFRLGKRFTKSYVNQLIIYIIIFSLILPLLFLQKGVAGNTIQFMHYFILFMGVLAGITVSRLIQYFPNPYIKMTFSLIIILLSVPTQIGLLYDFYSRPPTSKISHYEMQALEFLKVQPKTSTIMTPPYNQYLDLQQPIPPIWDWFDTSYVAAFSQKSVYIADTEQVNIMGYTLQPRLSLQKYIFENPQASIKQPLVQHNINYLYFPKHLKPQTNLTTSGLKKVYDNKLIEIWQVN